MSNTVNSLVIELSSIRTSLRTLGKLAAYGIPPTESTFQRFIQEAKSFRGAMETLELIKMSGLCPSFDAFNLLASKSATLSDVISVLEEMAEHRIWPEVKTFVGFLSNLKWEESVRVYYMMLSYQLRPSKKIFQLLSTRVFRNSDRAFFVLQQSILHGVFPDVSLFHLLIKESTTWRNSIASFNFFLCFYSPSRETFNLLLSKTLTIDQAFSVLEIMSFYECQITEVTHQILAEKNIYFCDRLEPLIK